MLRSSLHERSHLGPSYFCLLNTTELLINFWIKKQATKEKIYSVFSSSYFSLHAKFVFISISSCIIHLIHIKHNLIYHLIYDMNLKQYNLKYWVSITKKLQIDYWYKCGFKKDQHLKRDHFPFFQISVL